MTETIHCDTHGESEKTYVCTHLAAESSTGIGFNCRKPTKKKLFPDAWCDNCEMIRAAHNGWNKESERLTKIVLICSGCYERSRIRNTRPSVSLGDLAGLQWKCSNCEEWHTGPILDISFGHPHYWSDAYEKGSRWNFLSSGAVQPTSETFLDGDYCAIYDESFFVRGIINLPIIGAAESFRWGVWGSLSRTNFETLLTVEKDPKRVKLPPMFSWLSSQISEYPDTLNLKMHAHIQEPGMRPHFRLERCDHPLSQEYHNGISPERVKEIMFRSLPAQEQ